MIIFSRNIRYSKKFILNLHQIFSIRKQMKKFFCRLIVLFCVTGALIGCNSGTKTDSENNIRFDSLFVDKAYRLLEVEANPQCSLQIKFVYPTDYTNVEILRLLQQQFISGFLGDEYLNLAPKEAAEQYAQDFIEAYKAEEEIFRIEVENHGHDTMESWYTYNETSNNYIVYNRNDIVSFVAYKDCYYGGAHGSHQYTNRVVDLKTGQQITESDIFVEDYPDDLAIILVNRIALANQVEVTELENIGFFDVNEIYPNRNFYVDETGITYTFNEYEIAAYVVGPVSVTIPYDKIRHLLRKESPVSSIVFR